MSGQLNRNLELKLTPDTTARRVDLTIKGEIEVLRLQPGDVIVATVDRELTTAYGVALHEHLLAAFPGSSVAIVSDGIRLSVIRKEEPP